MDNQIESPDNEPQKFKIKNSWIYLTIIALLLGTNLYLFFQKKESATQAIQAQGRLTQMSSEKDVLQKEFDASLVRLDNLTGKNAQLEKALESSNSDVSQAKARIQAILNKSKATAAELKEARGLIKGLNLKIDSYEKQIAGLKQENANLTTQRDSISYTNTKLQEKVSLAQILHASNIRLKAIDLRRNGKKEKETTKAKRVDLLRISFDIDENRIAESGEKDLKIRITNPNGELLSNAALGSGSVVDHDGETIYYSLSKTIDLNANVPLKNIDVDWKQSADYQKGAYKVEVYYEGYLIGSGAAMLR